MTRQIFDVENGIKFSLIIGTLNRPIALEYCLHSLINQSYKNYEIIIVDQSGDDETENLVKRISQEKINYHHVKFKGLSKARNYGLQYAKGDYLCLIDDDAFYEKDFLSNAVNALKSFDSKTILSGYIYDTQKKGPFVKYRLKNNNKALSLRSIVRTCPSAGLVIPKILIKDVGQFDEQLGVGGKYPSGEETDMILRGIRRSYTVRYIRNLRLRHPYPIPDSTLQGDNDYKKRGLYYKGLGALFKKHMFINKMPGLLVCYLEVWIKLFIKKMLVFKYNQRQINYQIECFKEGVDKYNPQ